MGENKSQESSRNQNNPDVSGKLFSPEEYLFNIELSSLAHDSSVVDWMYLNLVATRTFIRLIIDIEMFQTHMRRLAEDGNLFFDSGNRLYRESVKALHQFGPAVSDIVLPCDSILIMRDGFALMLANLTIRNNPSAFWKQELAAPYQKFTPGDRDDLAAARLYQLAKTLPK